ncbi:MAG: hypothetical protein QOK42_2199 [Frankiaceae bacterium]|nr:hypothetical protein [Frankiaceae bacterium]MDX6275348.1 hypothetical protein [Frankiales bacterium]
MDLSALFSSARLFSSGQLPEPDASWTIPAAIVLGVIALILLVRKLIFFAVVLALLAAAFVAYQSGAFDEWVDKGKGVIHGDVTTG